MTELYTVSDFSGENKFKWHIKWAGVYLTPCKHTHTMLAIFFFKGKFDPLMKIRLNVLKKEELIGQQLVYCV